MKMKNFILVAVFLLIITSVVWGAVNVKASLDIPQGLGLQNRATPAIPAIPAIPYPGEGLAAVPAIPATPAIPSQHDKLAPIISDIQVWVKMSFSSADNDKSVSIRWFTDEDSDSVVNYGFSTGSYEFTVSGITVATTTVTTTTGIVGYIHKVDISDLSMGTTYYFRVNSTDSNRNTAKSNEYLLITHSLEELYLMEQVIDEIETYQEAYFEAYGQYIHQPKYWNSAISAYITVNEYLKPDGQRGYWIIIENDDYIKSVGYGPDAQMWIWEYIKDNWVDATLTP